MDKDQRIIRYLVEVLFMSTFTVILAGSLNVIEGWCIITVFWAGVLALMTINQPNSN